VLEQGRSLLPAGVQAVEGRFEAGDLVALLAPDGREVARGLVNYGAEELGRVAGCQSAEIEARLGSKPYDEAVHRNNMVLT
jgi:glutamate 5-kinase